MNGKPKAPDAREREVFLAWLDLPTAEARAAYLDQACAGDAALRASVESLLRHHHPDEFLETPVVEPPASAARGPAGTVRILSPSEHIGDRIGRYKLLQEIGEGGCGTVYMAEQEEPVRRRVALKIIKLGMDTKSVIARFEAERQALAMMDHPNIAKILDAGTTDTGRPYFVMELVRGIKITEYCDQNHLPTRERLQLFIQVCQAIQHAHQKGVLHRDVKPSNILVTLHDGVPVPKVIDFGIAKAIDQRLTDKTVFTEFQAFIGTPAYTSPEQAEMSGLDIDTRTDIYSLGVLLYEILTGKTPFDAAELAASGLEGMRRTIREREPIRPSTRLRTMVQAEATTTARRQQTEPARLANLVHGDLDWIVMKALEKDRTRRYETASSLANDVQRYLRNEPIIARPPSSLYQFQKFVRRHKLPFAAASAFALALILGLVISTWQFFEKSAALEREAEATRTQTLLSRQAELARHQAETQTLIARRKAYAADMNLLQEALLANNLGRAQELLDAQRPPPHQLDLRGWEWRYLWQHCRSDALFTLCQMSNEITSLSVSADGRWVAVGESGGGLTVWDLRARQEIARLATGGGRTLAKFSPTTPLLALVATDSPPAPEVPPPTDLAVPAPEPPTNKPAFRPPKQRVRLWDAESRRFTADLAVSGFCRQLAFATNGLALATLTADGRFTQWQLPSGDPAQSVQVSALAPSGPGMFNSTVQISHDLKLAALALPGGRLQVVDLTTGAERWSAQAAEENVTALAFSPDDTLLASGPGFVESGIRLWQASSGTELARLEGHRTWVSSLEFWPDGHTLASGSADQTINLWNLSDLRQFPARPEIGRPEPGRDADPRNLDRGFAETRGPEFLRRRPRRPWRPTLPPVATLRGHQLEVWNLALLPDARTLVSGSKDGAVCVWETTEVPRDHSHLTLSTPVRAWTFTPQDHAVIAVDPQGRVSRWHGVELEDGKPLAELGTNTANVVFSRDARYLAASSRHGRLQIWDLEQGKCLHAIEAGDRHLAPVAFCSTTNGLIAHEFPANLWREFDVATGRELRSWRSPTPLGFRWSAAISQDDQWLAVIGDDGTGFRRHLRTGEISPLALPLKQIQMVAWTPDGSALAVVSRLGTGILWDPLTAKLKGTLRGFLQGLGSVAFSADGARLAVGSDGNEAVKIWDLDGLQELLTLPSQGSMFTSVTFSPDGSLLGSSNSRGVLHIWRAPSWDDIQRLEHQASR